MMAKTQVQSAQQRKSRRRKYARLAGVEGDVQAAREYAKRFPAQSVQPETIATWRREFHVPAKASRVNVAELLEIQSDRGEDLGDDSDISPDLTTQRSRLKWSPRLHSEIGKSVNTFIDQHGSSEDDTYLNAARNYLPCYAATQYLRDHKALLHEHILDAYDGQLTNAGIRTIDKTGQEYELAINKPRYAWDDEELREEILGHLKQQPTVDAVIEEANAIFAAGRYYSPGLRAAGVDQFARDSEGNLIYMADYVPGEPRIEPETESPKFARTAKSARQLMHKAGFPQVVVPTKGHAWDVAELLALERELNAAEDAIKEHINAHAHVLFTQGANFRVDDPDDRKSVGWVRGGGSARGMRHERIGACIKEKADGDVDYAAWLFVNTKANGAYNLTGLKNRLGVDPKDVRHQKPSNLLVREVD